MTPDPITTTLAGRLHAAAAANSASPLVVDTPEGLVEGAVGQTLAAAYRVAAGLRERGIGPGDTVAVQLSNRPEAAVAYAAVLLTGPSRAVLKVCG